MCVVMAKNIRQKVLRVGHRHNQQRDNVEVSEMNQQAAEKLHARALHQAAPQAELSAEDEMCVNSGSRARMCRAACAGTCRGPLRVESREDNWRSL